MSRYQEIKVSIDPVLKALAFEAVEDADVSVSDFVRSALIHLVETGKVPFAIRRALPGRPYTPRGKAAGQRREETAGSV
jgi:antitoxin component of RelBE/YafQ-DinJ toxin-antitoxin module